MIRTIAFLAFLLAAALVARGDDGDDTLKFYLSKSDLVVMGTILNEPVAKNGEIGVPNYGCDFKISQVMKGDQKIKDTTIRLTIVRFEMAAADKNPLIKKDGTCILFLKKVSPDVPAWATVDVWFGVQQPSPWMAKSLARLATEK